MDSNIVSYLFELSYSLVIVGFIYYFLATQSNKSGKSLFKHWVIFGFVINLFGLSWLYSVYPLSWMERGFAQLFGIALLHLILSTGVALPYGLISLSVHKKIQEQYLPAAFALLVTLSELFRSIIISLLYYGNDSTIALHFTAGTIGNALSSTPLIEYAYFGGTFGLTFILSYCVYIFSSKKTIHRYAFHGIGICTVLIAIHCIVPTKLPRAGTTIGIINTYFPSPKTDDEEEYKELYRNQAEKINTITMSLASSSPSVIVYPEDTRYLSHLSSKERTTLVKRFPQTLFIDGDIIPTKNGLSNVTLFYYPEKEQQFARGKELLLPFNEYIPIFFRSIFRIFVSGELLSRYEKLHTFAPVYSKKTIDFGRERVGTLICSEILSYSTIRSLTKEEPTLVFFQSRLNVFHNNPWFVMHMRSFTKVAAAQMRTTVIASTSGAPSFIISPYGKMVRYIPASTSASTYTFKKGRL